MTTRFRWILCLAFIIALTIPLGSGLAITTPACDPDFVLQDSNVFTVLPTGTDDTANLQCAFDAAVAAGNGAEVRLVAADYHTAQIVVYDFMGKFSGAGANNTVIYNLPRLPVAVDFTYSPPSAENPWPDLFVFVDGDYSITKLAIHIVGDEPVEPWSIFGIDLYEMGGAIIFTGTDTHIAIDQVVIQGEVKEPSVTGYNLMNGIYYEGAPTLAGNLPVSGSYSLTNSTFRTVGWASPLYYLENASVVISHNNYEDVFVATDGADMVNSTLEYSHNKIKDAFIGLYFWNGDPPADTDTTFLVKNNQIWADLAGITFEQTMGEGTRCLILGNNVQNSNQYGIYLGPGTHDCTVVGGSNKTNVVDDGTNNILVGVNNMGSGVGPLINALLRPPR